MGRSGYQDDIDQRDLAMWRGRVASAIRGKRGQKLLHDLAAGMDAMPVKRLIDKDLVRDGEACALGCVGQHRKLPDLDKIDSEDHGDLSAMLDVAECLVQEVEYQNDEGENLPWGEQETPEKRWVRMRRWVAENLNETPPASVPH